ncbi:hypothetical protein C8Q79DRAFT_181164 [Trametes meyenii]|nr:hypothetical protein C8Q79DRAFT_181164 [Trametes meyenii]
MRRGFLLPKDKQRGQASNVHPPTLADSDARKSDCGSIGTGPRTYIEPSVPDLPSPATGYGGMRRGFLSSKPPVRVAIQEVMSQTSPESSVSSSVLACAQSGGGPGGIAPLSGPLNLALHKADTPRFGSLRRGFLLSESTATRKASQQIPTPKTALPLSPNQSLVENSKPVPQRKPKALEKVRIPPVYYRPLPQTPYALDSNNTKMVVTHFPGDADTSLINITGALLWHGTKEEVMALRPGAQ